MPEKSWEINVLARPGQEPGATPRRWGCLHSLWVLFCGCRRVCVCVCCFHLPLFDFHFSYAVLRLNDGLPLCRSSGLELECHRRGLAQRQRVESSLGPNEASSRGHWAPDLQIKNMPLLRLFKLTLFSWKFGTAVIWLMDYYPELNMLYSLICKINYSLFFLTKKTVIKSCWKIIVIKNWQSMN